MFVLSVKILRRFNRTRVGIDEENKSISKEKNPQPSFEVKHSKIITKRMGKNTGSKSIDKTESIALENNVPSNISTKEKLNKQQHKLNSDKKKKLNKRQHDLTSEKKKKKKKRKKRIFPRE